MLISELFRLTENSHNGDEFVIYKATSPNTEKVYYGYAAGSDDSDIKRAFFRSEDIANDPSRGTLRMIDAAGGEGEIEFEMLDLVGDEETAMITRNEEREKDPQSIVGPSLFPAHIYKNAREKNPEYFAKREKAKFEKMKAERESKALNKFRSAREAAHLFDPTELKSLRQKHGQAAVDDFSSMPPVHFQKKYGVSMKMPQVDG